LPSQEEAVRSVTCFRLNDKILSWKLEELCSLCYKNVHRLSKLFLNPV
jgi:hypothetical protein